MTDSNTTTTTTSSPSIKKRKIKNGSSSRSASEVISDQLSQDVQPTRKSQKTAREIMEELRKNQQLQQDEEKDEEDDEEQEVQDKSMEEYSSDSSNQDNSDVGNTSTTTTLNLPVAISNFNPTFKNSKTFNSCHLFGMKKEESLVIQGQYLLTVQKGTVSIYGASLKSGSNSSYPVYAAFASALPKITCIKNENNTKQEQEENVIITNYNKEFLENKEFDAVIFIEPLTSGLETIPEYFPKYSNLWGYTDEEANYTTATSTVVGHPKPLYYGPSTIKSVTSYASWQVTANEICEDVFRKRATSIAFIAGPKNSGKSSFAKYLQNFFLSNQKNNNQQQHLYFLDCDPGQSEFSPPSCLSLTKQTKLNFSCAFSHSNFQLGDLIKCHSLGSYSPKDLPEYFLACFEDLLTTFREEASQSSHASLLIINTPGWAKGQGLELLLEMIRLSQMSSVVFLGAKDLETFQDFHERLMAMSSYYQGGLIQRLCTPESPLTVSTINPSVQHNHDTMQQLFSATELRELQLLSYFHYSSKTSKFEFSCSTDSKTLAYIPPRRFQSSSSSSSSSQLTAENDQSLNRGALFSQIPILDKSHSNRFIRPRSILASRETLSGTNILSFGEQLYEAVIKRERELNVPIHGIAIVGIDGIKKKHLHICIENVIVSVLSVKAQVLNEYNQELIPLFMTEEESNIPSTKKNSTNVDSENEQESSSSYSSDNAEEEDKKEEKSLNVPLPLIPSQWLMDIINPKSTKSLGLAMIKSIDPVTGTLDLQTPIDEETLLQVQTNDEVLILFRGRIPLPSWTTL